MAEPGRCGVFFCGPKPSLRAKLSAAGQTAESVHLCDYPAGDPAAIDEDLSRRMALVREIASLGHSAGWRPSRRFGSRCPLVEIVLSDSVDQAWLEEHVALIRKELNVKKVEFTRQAEQYIDYNLLPDLKRLGPRLGKRLPALRQMLAKSDPGSLMETMKAEGQVSFCLPTGRSRSTRKISRSGFRPKRDGRPRKVGLR